MKGRLKKILSFFLVIGLVGGVCQIPAEKTLAATTPVKLDNLGSHGTTKIGSKTKSGDWYKMTVESKTAFCMNLGYTCHKGQKALFLSEKIWKNECFFLIPLCHRFAGRNVR